MAKKYCSNCGAEIPDGARFCPKCGKPVLPDDENLMDSTQIVEHPESDQKDTAQIPHFDNNERTQNISTSYYGKTQSDYYSQHHPEPVPYNNPDYTDSYEYEAPEHHVGLIVLIVIIAACVSLFFFLFFAKPEVLTNLIPGHHDETTVEETAKPEKKEKTQASEDTETSSPDALETAPAATDDTPVAEDGDSEAASITQTGNVYISTDVNGPRRIKVRTGPSQSATDTGARKYDGDSVTVYETKQAEGYTWYRIGDNQWIAGNSSTFGIRFN